MKKFIFNKNRIIATIIFIALTTISYTIIEYLYYQNSLINGSVSTTGKIIAENARGVLVFEYTVDGMKYSCSGRNGKQKGFKTGDLIPVYKIGDMVPVYYSRTSPDYAMLYVPEILETGPYPVWFLFGGVFWLLALSTIIWPDSPWTLDFKIKKKTPSQQRW